MFEMREKYGVGTFRSTHPRVNDYVARTMGALRGWLECDAVRSVAVVVLQGEQHRVIARYTFETRVVARHAHDVSDVALAALDDALRAQLCRVLHHGAEELSLAAACSPAELQQQQQQRTFDVIVSTSGVHADARWMRASAREQHSVSSPVLTVALKDADEVACTARVQSWLQLPSRASSSHARSTRDS
ncbi:unnamed protein product [Agarophyton chilense]